MDYSCEQAMTLLEEVTVSEMPLRTMCATLLSSRFGPYKSTGLEQLVRL